jgi:hypothetical protein
VPTIPLRRSRRDQRREAAERERREAEALARTIQRDEDHLTGTIRAGAVGYAPPTAPAGWQPSATDAGNADAEDIGS